MYTCRIENGREGERNGKTKLPGKRPHSYIKVDYYCYIEEYNIQHTTWYFVYKKTEINKLEQISIFFFLCNNFEFSPFFKVFFLLVNKCAPYRFFCRSFKGERNEKRNNKTRKKLINHGSIKMSIAFSFA